MLTYLCKMNDELTFSDEFKLTIGTNKTFTPTALNLDFRDNRQMGVHIFLLYLSENIK